MTGSFNVSGPISASFFVGDGSQLTNLPSSPSGISSLIATGSVTASVNVNNFIFSIISESISHGIIDANANNTSYGNTTLNPDATGIQNTAFGGGTLYLNTTGFFNTAIGFYSLQQNTIGSFNTSLGMVSLNRNILGDGNTGIGYASLNLNVSGSNNVAIGRGAGQLNVSGSSNVFIGYNAGRNETSSNKLYIANSNTSTPLIKGDFTSGSITINNILQITPQHPLPAAASYPNSFAVSSSTPPVPYFSDGTSWTALY